MNLVELGRRRVAGMALALGVLFAAGAWQASRLPSAIFPTVTFPTIKVIAESGEEPAASMMPLVTRPLEEAIRRVPGAILVRSITSRGSSELSVNFRWGTDMQNALHQVQAETQRMMPALPSGTRIDVEWMNTATFPVYGIGLVSDTLTQAELLDLARYRIEPALLSVDGISEVQVQGGVQREYRVELDRAALDGHHLAAADVVDAVRKNDQVISAGLVEQNHELYLTLATGRVRSPEGLARIEVPVTDGVPVPVAELGRVSVENEVSYVLTTASGQPAVLVNVLRQPAGNTVTIVRDVDRLLRSRPDLIPPGVRVVPFYDQARFVSASVDGTRDAVAIGVVLAALVLLVFLRSVRLMLVSALAIPVTVALVLLVLSFLGETINLMTLAGIAAAVGLIADDAIVVVENIRRHEEDGGDDPASTGLSEILPALVGSSLSTTVILVPFTLLTGVAGAFFRPLALTMALSLLVSFAIAVLVVPVATTAGRRAHAGRRASVPPRLARVGRSTVSFFVRRGWVSLLVVAVLAGAAWVLYRAAPTDFLPAMDEGTIVLDYRSPPGTSLTDTDHMLAEAEKVILSLPDVESTSRRTGTQLGFFITEPDSGDVLVNLKPRSRRRPVDEVIDDIRERVAAVEPALRTDFGQLLEDVIGDLTGGEPQPIDVRISGDDPGVLQARARDVARILRDVPGTEDVFDGIVIAGPALTVELKPEAAARYGLTTESLHAALEPAVAGSVVDQVMVGERTFDLRVRAMGAGPLADRPVRTPSGAMVPLREVADVFTGAPEAEIDRENLRTYVAVTARISGRDLGGVMAEIRSRVGREVPLAPGMSITYGGLYREQQASFASLALVLLAGLVLVSVIVAFEFGDLRASLVVSLAAVAVLAGVLAALRLTGMSLNISSYVGAILMVGIVGENAIFVIHEARLELRRGLTPVDAWRAASLRRLRPVFMTVLATSFALAPLAVAIGEGSQLMQPLAVAVIGGFVLSGPVVLLVVPGLYRWMDPRGALGRG